MYECTTCTQVYELGAAADLHSARSAYTHMNLFDDDEAADDVDMAAAADDADMAAAADDADMAAAAKVHADWMSRMVGDANKKGISIAELFRGLSHVGDRTLKAYEHAITFFGETLKQT